jgi:hypothetical protein
MSNRLRTVPGIVLGLLALGAAVPPAHADWLVTRDGGKVETKGTWQIKGKLVVFTRAADGALASLRASEVDLDASAKATAEAKVQSEAPPPPEAPKKKIAVLTDKDFRKPAPAADAGEAPKEVPPSRPGRLVVSDWKKVDSSSEEGVTVEGTIQNTTGDLIVNASVEVQLFNDAGERVGTAPGILTSASVKGKDTVHFRASFPGVFTFATAKFQTGGVPLNVAPPAEDKPADQAPPP